MKHKMTTQVRIAYDLLLEQILSFELEPGSSISDNQVSKMLNMSRAPVREAILLLEMDGLICDSNSGRSIVAPIQIDDIIDIIRVRTALETEAVSIIADAGWLTAKQKQTLQEIHQRFIDASLHTDAFEQYRLDDLFHAELVAYSNSTRIIDMLDQMRLQMQRARWLNQIVPERQRDAAKEHTQIIEAILKEDLYQATDAIRQHLSNSRINFEAVSGNLQMRQVAKMISSVFSRSEQE